MNRRNVIRSIVWPELISPRLSVITRTRGRRLLLERAGRGIAAALPAGSEWIIVCDDPQPDPTIRAIAARVDLPNGAEVKVVETGGVGRSGALNAGVQAASGEYLHFHDDDDTILADFYDRTLPFLDDNPNYGAVVTWVERREEEVVGDTINQLSAVPHNPGLRTITFARLASACIFPPIAFVARGSCVSETGQFDPALDVAEDYDFFLRFLCRYDIGVIGERLCAVHVRPRTAKSSDLANSSASDNFEEVDALYRNARFRRDFESGELGLGWLLLIGELARTTSRLDAVLNGLRKAPFFDRVRRLLG